MVLSNFLGFCLHIFNISWLLSIKKKKFLGHATQMSVLRNALSIPFNVIISFHDWGLICISYLKNPPKIFTSVSDIQLCNFLLFIASRLVAIIGISSDLFLSLSSTLGDDQDTFFWLYCFVSMSNITSWSFSDNLEISAQPSSLHFYTGNQSKF